MSACGNCGSSIICSCHFVEGCTEGSCTTLTGNGRTFSPINYRPDNVPLTRPFGFLTAENLGDQLIGINTTAAVIFDESNFNGVAFNPLMTTSMVNLSTPTRLTALESGYFIVYGYVDAKGENYFLRIRKNGTEYLGNQEGVEQSTALSNGNTTSLMTITNMNINDYLELIMTSRGTSVTVLSGTDTSLSPSADNAVAVFCAYWVRPL